MPAIEYAEGNVYATTAGMRSLEHEHARKVSSCSGRSWLIPKSRWQGALMDSHRLGQRRSRRFPCISSMCPVNLFCSPILSTPAKWHSACRLVENPRKSLQAAFCKGRFVRFKFFFEVWAMEWKQCETSITRFLFCFSQTSAAGSGLQLSCAAEERIYCGGDRWDPKNCSSGVIPR